MRVHFYLRWWFAALVFLLLAGPARATHIVGGELDMQYLSGDSYRLSLTLYFDAVNGSSAALDNDVTASIFERGTNRRITDLMVPLTQNQPVAYTSVACAIGSLSTRKLTYTRNIDLPAGQFNSPNGYYVAVERCCRNGVISNIVSPGDAGQTYYLEFPAVVRNGQAFRNSSPRIFPPLSDYACLGELFYFDFGGQDADGDSLVYDMVTPLNGHATPSVPRPTSAYPAPYSPITWSAGLSQTNQMPGAPTLSVNARSGRLTVRPTRQGLFVFGVRCSEFRRGVKIGETRRDFQLLVISCPRNQTPQMTVRPPGNGMAPYRPGRDTLHLLTGQNRCLRLSFTDPDPSTRLQMELLAVNFPQAMVPVPTVRQGTVHAAGQPDTITSTLCFPDCFNTRGRVFLLDVIVADDGCSLPRRDTVRVAFTAQGPPNQAPSVALVAPPTRFPISARVGDLVQLDVEGLDADLDPVTLELTGRGFSAAAVGAQLSAVSNVPGRTVAHFSWRVSCDAVARGLHEFQLVAAATPCQERQTSPVLVLPIQVEYRNAAPVLTSSFPAALPDSTAPVVIRVPLGGTYTATLAGTDADRDALSLTAAGAGFELAAVGMSLSTSGGPGAAAGTFRWQASCESAKQEPLDVTFTLVDNTCVPIPKKQLVRFEVQRPDAPEFTPNIITPNGDNANEYFALPTLPPDFCDQRFASIKIFSRWGNEIYRSSDRAFRWSGRGVTEGVYYYLVEYTDGRKFKGWLTVVAR